MSAAIAVPLPSPLSARARSRPRGRAAAAASGRERFGAGSEIFTILICYDGTPGARRALERTGGLLPGSRAVVLTVWTWPAQLAACGLAGAAPPGLEDARRAASEMAADGVRRARSVGLDAVALTTNGMAEGIQASILAAADDWGAHIIVVGSRGRTGLRAVLAGSLSRGLAARARQPVLVVPSERPEGARGRGMPTRRQGRAP
jgi:nucleotide-binding universal stress UspA family protein